MPHVAGHGCARSASRQRRASSLRVPARGSWSKRAKFMRLIAIPGMKFATIAQLGQEPTVLAGSERRLRGFAALSRKCVRTGPERMRELVCQQRRSIIVVLLRWILRNSARLPARAVAPRIRLAPLTSGPATRRVLPGAKAAPPAASASWPIDPFSGQSGSRGPARHEEAIIAHTFHRRAWPIDRRRACRACSNLSHARRDGSPCADEAGDQPAICCQLLLGLKPRSLQLALTTQ